MRSCKVGKGGSVRELTSGFCAIISIGLSLSRQKTNICRVVRSESINSSRGRRDKARYRHFALVLIRLARFERKAFRVSIILALYPLLGRTGV